MSRPKNAMEIFKHLEKSNCRECGEKSCLAFAGAVFTGAKSIDACPRADEATRALFRGGAGETGDNGDIYLAALQEKMGTCDFDEASRRIGATLSGEVLTLKVLGKDVGVDHQGRFHTDLHVNPYLGVPFLNHVLDGKGVPAKGQWVSYRDIPGGREQYNLFHRRCEENLLRLADGHTGLFDDLVHLFDAKEVPPQFQSDISVVLHFFPTVPFMICYCNDQDGLGSAVNVYYDSTAIENVDAESLFYLGVGFTYMLERLALRHG
ncbi:DUF3786 domain-containing protein [Desulfoluna butyratoxydans]|uniref:4fe-4s domain n=1 Tax=Desulfoluna butyratoxydans TaxID=231438 RepID=A0A4U8YT81_9BACT|nr:DUF3786 domain-containing protein [Desulfoluna butyratoxydans]VFQ46757.1 4fe-4s domain [Desulfoluna butyratoxydans]